MCPSHGGWPLGGPGPGIAGWIQDRVHLGKCTRPERFFREFLAPGANGLIAAHGSFPGVIGLGNGAAGRCRDQVLKRGWSAVHEAGLHGLASPEHREEGFWGWQGRDGRVQPHQGSVRSHDERLQVTVP